MQSREKTSLNTGTSPEYNVSCSPPQGALNTSAITDLKLPDDTIQIMQRSNAAALQHSMSRIIVTIEFFAGSWDDLISIKCGEEGAADVLYSAILQSLSDHERCIRISPHPSRFMVCGSLKRWARCCCTASNGGDAWVQSHAVVQCCMTDIDRSLVVVWVGVAFPWGARADNAFRRSLAGLLQAGGRAALCMSHGLVFQMNITDESVMSFATGFLSVFEEELGYQLSIEA
eukprot:2635187-Amphidinium_carterae.1